MTANREGLEVVLDLSDAEVGAMLAAALTWLHLRCLELEAADQVPEQQAGTGTSPELIAEGRP